jgi:hypothetical protein
LSEILVNKLTGTSTAGSILVTGEGNSTTTNLQQGLAKASFCMNVHASTTYHGVAAGSISSQTFNISSGTDAGTGLIRGSLTNAMGSLQYVWTEGCLAANNLCNLDVGVSTTSLLASQQHDADTGSDIDVIGCTVAYGDLA